MDWSKCYNTSNEIFNGVATFDCLPPLVANFTYWAFVFVGILAVFFIIYAGFLYVRSGGDQKQVQAARSTLTFAIIGLIIVLSSVFILNIISRVTGIGCLRSFGLTACKSSNSSPSNIGRYYCSSKNVCVKSTTGTEGGPYFTGPKGCEEACGK